MGRTESSSQTDVRLLQHPVHYEALTPFPQPAGAECVFLGRTRTELHPTHGELRRLTYEAYATMAEAVLHDLARHAVDKFDCRFVRIHHALGEIAPGEASVLVHVVCGHRAAAFDACRYLIDELKSTAPIWKREEWADGSTWSAGVPVAKGELA